MQKISILHTFKIYLTKKYIIFGVQFPFKVKEKETKLTGFLLMQNIIVLYTELFCKWKGSKFLHPRDKKYSKIFFCQMRPMRSVSLQSSDILPTSTW